MKKITTRTDRTKLKTGIYLLDDRSEITYYRIESEYYFIGDYYFAKEFVLGYNDDDISLFLPEELREIECENCFKDEKCEFIEALKKLKDN